MESRHARRLFLFPLTWSPILIRFILKIIRPQSYESTTIVKKTAIYFTILLLT